MKVRSKLVASLLAITLCVSLLPVVSPVSPAEAAVTWTKYPGVLKLDSGQYAIDASVIKDGDTYKMWYTHLSANQTLSQIVGALRGLNLNGIANAFSTENASQLLDSMGDLSGNVTLIVSLLNSINPVIGYATSADGKNWTVQNPRALVGASSGLWSRDPVYAPTVIKDGTVYRMWYTSLTTHLTPSKLQSILTNISNNTTRTAAILELLGSTYSVIGYATSDNGADWNVQNPGSLVGSSSGLWSSVGAPSVIKEGSTYKMWYTRVRTDFTQTALNAILANIKNFGVASLLSIFDGTSTVIDYATSDNGTDWTVQNYGVLSSTALWESVADPSVIKTGVGYEMWYTNARKGTLNAAGLGSLISQIGSLGINTLWNTLKTQGVTQFLIDLMTKDATPIKNVLGGTNTAIGYATSTNGVNWVVQDSQNLVGNSSGLWSSVTSPTVVKTDKYDMWYIKGVDNLTWQKIFDRLMGADLSIGYAYTTAKVLSSIEVTPATDTVPLGSTKQFTAIARYSDGSSENITGATGIIWNSTNVAKVPINNVGLATGVGLGSTIITASFAGMTSNQAVLNVIAPELTTLTVAPASPSVALGRTLPFSAIAIYSDNTTANVTALASWTSANTTVATIAAGGLATTKAIGTTTITATYGGKVASTSMNVTAAEFVGMVITPVNPMFAAGTTDIQFYATDYYTDGSTVDRTSSANWTSSNTTVATIVSTTGVAKALAAGYTTISATYSGNSANTTLTVLPATLNSVAITAPTTSVTAGKWVQLTLTGNYSDNTTQDLTGASTTIWASLDLTKALVSTTGNVTGVASGNVTIRATNSGQRATIVLTVTPATLENITVTPATPKIVASNSVQFTATGVYSNGSTADLTATANWTSSVPATANITATGLATAGTAAGTTNITATYGVISGNTTLTVTTATLDLITVTPSNPSVAAGRTQQFNATGNFSDNTSADITGLVTWSSSNTAVATIAAGGLATSKASGTANITATLGAKSGSTTLSVTAPELGSITVVPTNPSIAAGRTQQFTATGVYSDGSTASLTATANWTSSVPATANITATGVALGRAVGAANITATWGSISGNTTLTVTAAVLDAITITPPSASIVAGRQQQFNASGSYSDGSSANITSIVTWSSSNTAVASVDTAGLATSYSPGSTNITATYSGKSQTATLAVSAAVVDSVTVTPANPTIYTGNSQTFRAMATYSNGAKVDVTASASWSSSNTTVVASVAAGVASSLAAGSTTITATFSGVPGSTTLTVTAAPLSSIAVSPSSPSIAAGRTQQFAATGNFSGTVIADITSQVRWASSNNNTARVNSLGLATSYVSGTVNITASMGGVSSLPVTLTVGAAELESISVAPRNPVITFRAGNAPTVQFFATRINSDGATTDATTTASWTSSNTAVASIGANTGLATTGAAGSTVITANLTGKTDSVTLTVLPDTIPPVITLTSPSEGQILNVRTLTVSGSVDDKSASASAVVNGISFPLTLDSNGNFSRYVLLNVGSNIVRVNATDLSGNTGSTGTVTVRVDPNKPGITITSPADGTLTNNPALTVTGNITNAVSATMIVNGAAQSVTVAAGGFSGSVTLSEGENIIVVQAYTTGQTGADYLGTSGARKVILDTTAPRVTITSLVSGSVVNTPQVTVAGTIDDPAVTTALLILNGVPQSIPVANGAFRQDVTLSPGTNSISVVATDRAGNTSPTTSPTTVTLDTSKPGVTIIRPANKLVTKVLSQTVSGNISDPSISTATLYVNGASQTISVAPDGSFSQVVPLILGLNTVEVRASDAAGNIGQSGVINVTVDTTAPVINIGLLDPTDSTVITVMANEALAAAPTVSVSSNVTASANVTMTQIDVGKWSGVYGSAATPITDGEYTVTVTGSDEALNTATKTATFTKKTISVSGVAPTTVTTPSASMAVETNGAVSNVDISVTYHTSNPSGNVANPADAARAAGVFLEINASPELRDALKQIYIRVDYDRTTLPVSTNESSLKLYLWDLTSGTWQVVDNSTAHVAEQYIDGTIDHLSKFGGFGTVTVTPPAPPAPPVEVPGITIFPSVIPLVFSNIMAADITSTSVAIKWTTDKSSTSQVEYKWDGSSKLSPLDETLVLNHVVQLTGLNPSTTYRYRVMSKDAYGNLSVSDEYTFTTAGVPAAFTLSNLTISPAEVKIGETVTIGATVTNTGGVSGSYDVVLKINNVVVSTQKVTLGGGVSQKVTFTVTRDAVGTYNVTIESLSGVFRVVTVAVPPKPAAFVVGNLVVSPAEVKIGETVTISATVANTGEVSGSYDVVLKINNVVVSTQKVTLGGGVSQKVTFTVTRDTAGTYSVNVNGLSGAFEVKVVVALPKPVNWGAIIGGIAAAVVVLVAIVVILVRRRRVTG